MTLGTRCRSALKALIHLARAGDGAILTVADLARATDARYEGLRRTFRRLAQAGIVVALRGSHGGVALAVPPSAISVADVVEALAASRDDGNSGSSDPGFARLASLDQRLWTDSMLLLRRVTVASLALEPPAASSANSPARE
jgi:Rrf2 family protein